MKLSDALSPEQYKALTAKPKRNKHGNVRVVVDGLKFDSKAEANRWQVLKMLEKIGDIRDLRRQVRFDLIGDGKDAESYYLADFTYRGNATNVLVVEDVKGAPPTAVFKLKAKLFKARYGFDITVRRAS